MMKRHSPIAIVLLLLVLTVALPARAQSVGLAPGEVRADFKPGSPFQFEINVQNYGSTPVQLTVEINDFWYSDKSEVNDKGDVVYPKVFGTPGTSPRSAANWIQFVPEKFVLQPNGVQKMRAIVTPPATASDGGYYASLFVVSQPVLTNKVTKEGGAVYTNMRIGCLVELNAKGSEKYALTVSDPKLTPPSASQDLKLQFTVENQSNTHVRPRPRLAILDSRHKVVGKGDGDEKRLLPGQKEEMEVTWSGKPAPGMYTAVLTVVYGETHVETKSVPFEVKP